MKFTKKDVVDILWKFDQLGGAEVVDDTLIRGIVVTNPSSKNTLLSFEFDGYGYFALFDMAGDNSEYVRREVLKVHPNTTTEMLKSPKGDGLSLSFKGKEVYLAIEKKKKKRLDVWLSERDDAVGRSTWQKHIKNGHVTVNGTTDIKSSMMVGADDEVKVDLPEDGDFKDEMPIIYEDSDVVVIDKPAGVLTHSKGELNDEFSVAVFLKRFNKDQEETNRTGIVHRLDRDTSGVMIGAKTVAGLKKLQKQFSERKVKKTYYAVVEGCPKAEKAVLDLPIARNMKHPTTFVVSPNGRPAETVYEVVKAGMGRTLLKLMPKTGRTHQLRVHLKYIGHPIVGDRIYGAKADRLYLHAAQLEVTLLNGERKILESKVPKEFLEAVK